MCVYVEVLSDAQKTPLTLKVQSSDNIKYLKQLIQNENGIPPEQQILKFRGQKLKDGDTLRKYNIQTVLGFTCIRACAFSFRFRLRRQSL